MSTITHTQAAAAVARTAQRVRQADIDCTCGHPWALHTRQRNGSDACRYHGCGCHDAVSPAQLAVC